MTLKELLNQIESTAGKTLPTAACLRAGCQVAAIQELEENGTLIVYQNGFALYEVEGACTVLRADHCGDYVLRKGHADGDFQRGFFRDGLVGASAY